MKDPKDNLRLLYGVFAVVAGVFVLKAWSDVKDRGEKTTRRLEGPSPPGPVRPRREETVSPQLAEDEGYAEEDYDDADDEGGRGRESYPLSEAKSYPRHIQVNLAHYAHFGDPEKLAQLPPGELAHMAADGLRMWYAESDIDYETPPSVEEHFDYEPFPGYGRSNPRRTKVRPSRSKRPRTQPSTKRKKSR